MGDTSVLIVGAGPIGLALAADLGWRGVPCLVIEQNDGVIDHPRATAVNARTMEFLRRWGIADAVREAGTPPDFPHTVLFVTRLHGFEIARIERPGHGGREPDAHQPRAAAALQPALARSHPARPRRRVRQRAARLPLRASNPMSSDQDHVEATVRDLASDTLRTVRRRIISSIAAAATARSGRRSASA